MGPVLSSSSANKPVIKAGPLADFEQGWHFQGWKKRWVVLFRDGSLSIRPKNPKKREVATVMITTRCRVNESDLPKNLAHKFGFRLSTSDQSFDFYAETRQDRHDWIVVMRAACINSLEIFEDWPNPLQEGPKFELPQDSDPDPEGLHRIYRGNEEARRIYSSLVELCSTTLATREERSASPESTRSVSPPLVADDCVSPTRQAPETHTEQEGLSLVLVDER
eukprot:gnl/Spiro4/29647_TR14540_c0_g1_i1.p1 gnl/Spiro4/29647_TR14540_c0_g1~~gnl/Spiro4/29647_TR14540_c0_g1_i1.p1  ORF type:complete len:222 (+),score=22.96 gnl/Spiro4/29647_TR14540_c0_g1_i1:63-728(+)